MATGGANMTNEANCSANHDKAQIIDSESVEQHFEDLQDTVSEVDAQDTGSDVGSLDEVSNDGSQDSVSEVDSQDTVSEVISEFSPNNETSDAVSTSNESTNETEQITSNLTKNSEEGKSAPEHKEKDSGDCSQKEESKVDTMEKQKYMHIAGVDGKESNTDYDDLNNDDQSSSCNSEDEDQEVPESSGAKQENNKEKTLEKNVLEFTGNYTVDVYSKDKLSEENDSPSRWSCAACPPFCAKQKDTEIGVLSPEEEKAAYIAREKRAILKNLCIVSVAFLFVFSAFQGLTRLQSSLHRDAGMGTICQSVMYSALVLSCLVLPNLSIHTIGLKKTIIISFFGYIIWFAANGYAVWGTMVTASIIMGIAAGPMWTAQSSYFTILASHYAELSGKDRSAVLSKFFGIFFAFYQFSGIVGSVITTVVLLPSEKNFTADGVSSCGARDCPWAETIQGHLAKPDKVTVWIMLTVFLIMSLVAVLITYYFVEDLPVTTESHLKMTSDTESEIQSDKTSQTAVSDTITFVSTLESTPKEFHRGIDITRSRPSSFCGSQISGHEIQLYESVECVYPGEVEHIGVKPVEEETQPEVTKPKKFCDIDNCKMIFSTLRHLRHLDQILLVPMTFYMGLEQGTSAANFTKSYIACSIGIAKIGLVYISYSAINGLASFTSGRLVKYTGRFPVLTTAFIGDLIVQSTLQLWTPDESQQYVLYLLAGLWGFTDGIWHTQVSALYGAIFTEDPTAAFSCLRLLKAIGAITAFAYSSSLCTNVKVYILTSLLIVSMVGYYAVEFRQKFWKKKKVHFEEDMVVAA